MQIRLCGQEDSEGVLLTTLKELSDADPHAAHSAIHYSLQSRVDYLLETHLPDQTRDLAEAVGASASGRTYLNQKARADLPTKMSPHSFGISSA